MRVGLEALLDGELHVLGRSSRRSPRGTSRPERSLNVHVRISFERLPLGGEARAVLEGLGIALDQRVVDAVPQGLLGLRVAPGEGRLGAPLADGDDEAVGLGRGAGRKAAARPAGRRRAVAVRFRNERRSMDRLVIDDLSARMWRDGSASCGRCKRRQTIDVQPVAMRLALSAILLLAAVLRLWRLDQNGFGNEYYSAGVRSMSAGWHNILYHAFDPAGFISVDKPPVAMWLQVATVKLFGFHGLSVLVPQVIEGVLAVWLVHQPWSGGASARRRGCWRAVPGARRRQRGRRPVEQHRELPGAASPPGGLGADARDRGGSRRAARAVDGAGRPGLQRQDAGRLRRRPDLRARLRPRLAGEPSAPAARPDARLVVLVMASAAWLAAYDLHAARIGDRTPAPTDRNAMAELVMGPYGVGRFVRQPRARRSQPGGDAGRQPSGADGAPGRAEPAEPGGAPLRARAGGPTAAGRRPARGQALWLLAAGARRPGPGRARSTVAPAARPGDVRAAAVGRAGR